MVNFKAYRETEGPLATAMAEMCGSVSEETGACIIVCPPMTELGAVARSVRIPVFAQNADPHAPGPATGWATPSMIRSSGAVGAMIGHSEHMMPADGIGRSVELCRACGLTTIVCADTAASASRIASFSPDFIAVEPPELIGGDVSVTTADPDIIRRTVGSVKAVCKDTSVLCGAGIKTGDDLRNALDLGAEGVLLASGVVKAKDPRAALTDLARSI